MATTFSHLEHQGTVAIFKTDYFSFVEGRATNTFALNRENILIRIKNMEQRCADVSEEKKALNALGVAPEVN